MKLDERSGVFVSGVRDGSFAEDAGVRHGDIVKALDGKPVETLEVFRQSCRSLSDARAEKILVEVRRGRVVNYHLMKPIYKKTGEDQAEEKP
jgi:serine protease Do